MLKPDGCSVGASSVRLAGVMGSHVCPVTSFELSRLGGREGMGTAPDVALRPSY